MVGKTFKNTSGKTVQVPNRISEEFCWEPGERIVILEKQKLVYENPYCNQDGFIVHNIDYVGIHCAHETSWIDEKTLTENFTEITE